MSHNRHWYEKESNQLEQNDTGIGKPYMARGLSPDSPSTLALIGALATRGLRAPFFNFGMGTLSGHFHLFLREG